MIQKVTDGLTGAQAADLLYANDIELQGNTQRVTNDLSILTAYAQGKTATFAIGATGNASRVGVNLPVGYLTGPLTVRFTCTSSPFSTTIYWQNNVGGNLMTPINIVWVSDGAGAFYYEAIVNASSTATTSTLFAFVNNSTTLSVAVTLAMTVISHMTILKDEVAANTAAITANTTAIAANGTTITANKALTDAALKPGNIDITPYADKQTLTIPASSTAGLRITFTIPINLLAVGDTVRLQFKSVGGANATKVTVYKVLSTKIADVIWTLNSSDGFYYSQVYDVVISSGDIAAAVPFVVFLQAFNASGLTADTISVVQEFVFRNYIDVVALRTQVNAITVPTNLLNTLEIGWRGYQSMTKKTVKADGTGDFTTIQAAINSITDAAINKQYDIQVFDDFNITDLTQLWLQATPASHNASATAPTASCALVITKNWVHIRGMGSPKRLYIESPTTLDANSFQYIQTIFAQGNCIIANFYVGIKGGRYAIHQESGGSTTSDDYHATTIYNNLVVEHKGNRAADGYTSNWSSTYAQANGTTSGLKVFYTNVEWRAVDINAPFYTHTNAAFDDANEITFVNCKMVIKGSYTLNSFNPYWGDIGSGQCSIIRIIGSNFGKFTINNTARYNETTMTLANKWNNGGAIMQGYGNAPFVCNIEIPAVLSFKSVANNVDVKVTGGTALAAIFGTALTSQSGSVDQPGIAWGEIRIEAPNFALGASQIFNLPYRLGNCATVNKTLIVNVGGTDYTITFNKNYMTTDGSSYFWNTTPALTLASIMTDINAAYPSIFTASLGETTQYFSFADCMEKGVNFSTTVTLRLGKGVVRDYSANANGAWRLSQVGERAEGIVGQRINPIKSGNYFEGNILIIKNTNILYSVLGITPTAGTYWKCGADGSFVSGTSTDSTFIAIDSTTLKAL